MDASTSNAYLKLDDTKAGMKLLNKEEINKKIIEASKGSSYYETQLKKSNNLQKRIQQQKCFLSKCDKLQYRAANLKMEKLHKSLIAKQNLDQIIMHIDLDAFFAACEMRDDPKLYSLPVAVGSMQMISTSNYIARKYGVRAAMPGFIGKKLCPQLKLISHDIQKYRETSSAFFDILKLYVKSYSFGGLDEAYCNLTNYMRKRSENELSLKFTYKRKCLCFCHTNPLNQNNNNPKSNQPDHTNISHLACNNDLFACSCRFVKKDERNIYDLPGCIIAKQELIEYTQTYGNSIAETAKEIRHRIYEATGVTCSIGIAPTHQLAKICSDMDKPNGQFILLPNDNDVLQKFIGDTPINKINGIGKVTSALLNALGIEKCRDIWTHRAKIALLYSDIFCRFVLSVYLGGVSRTQSNSVDKSNDGPSDNEDSDDVDDMMYGSGRKSIGIERTLNCMDVRSETERIYEICRKLCQKLSEDLKERGIAGSVLTVKMKSSNFRVLTRAKKLPQAINDTESMVKVAWELIKPEMEIAKHAAKMECQRLKELPSRYITPFKRSMRNYKPIHEIIQEKSNINLPNIRDSLIKFEDQSVTQNCINELEKTNNEKIDNVSDLNKIDSFEPTISNDSINDENICGTSVANNYNSNDQSLSSPLKANDKSSKQIEIVLKQKSNDENKSPATEDSQDFLYLRLLGVRMLKLVNNRVNQNQTNYLANWIHKTQNEDTSMPSHSPKDISKISDITHNTSQNPFDYNNINSDVQDIKPQCLVNPLGPKDSVYIECPICRNQIKISHNDSKDQVINSHIDECLTFNLLERNNYDFLKNPAENCKNVETLIAKRPIKQNMNLVAQTKKNKKGPNNQQTLEKFFIS